MHRKKYIYKLIKKSILALTIVALLVTLFPTITRKVKAYDPKLINYTYDGSSFFMDSSPLFDLGTISFSDAPFLFVTVNLTDTTITDSTNSGIECDISSTTLLFDVNKTGGTYNTVQYEVWIDPSKQTDLSAQYYSSLDINVSYKDKELKLSTITATFTKGTNVASLDVASTYKYGELWNVSSSVTHAVNDPVYKISGFSFTQADFAGITEKYPYVYVSRGDNYISVEYEDSSGHYSKAEASKTVTIERGDLTVKVPSVKPGEDYNIEVSGEAYGVPVDTSGSTFYYQEYNEEVGVEVPMPTAPDVLDSGWDKYNTTKPTKPGKYVVAVLLNDDLISNYNVPYTIFNIIGSAGKASIEVKDIEYGQKLEPVVKSDDYDVKLATITYKLASEDDSKYTKTLPTKPGKYTARAYFPENSSFLECAVTCNFEIKKIEGEGTVKVNSIVYGETPKPQIESKDYDKNKVDIYYKLSGEDNSKFKKDTPTIPGSYVVRAVFKENDLYAEHIDESKFTISKVNGEGTVVAKDIYLGMKMNIIPSSSKNGTASVKYYYKEQGASDSAYLATEPSKIGNYTVKAVFPETEGYYEAKAEANFKITYMPSPGYSISGTKGKGDFYTSDVTIKAPEGYLISTTFGSGYVDSLKYSSASQSSYMYFKNKSTGALSDKVTMPTYKIDSKAPEISNTTRNAITNHSTIYKASELFTITDDNLETVIINGENVQVSNGKASFNLTANRGKKEYVIIASDRAGHEIKYTVVVAEPWLESGIIPSGTIVRLEPATEYKLDGGKWKVDGDDTVYSGNINFFVANEEEHIFTKD